METEISRTNWIQQKLIEKDPVCVLDHHAVAVAVAVDGWTAIVRGRGQATF